MQLNNDSVIILEFTNLNYLKQVKDHIHDGMSLSILRSVAGMALHDTCIRNGKEATLIDYCQFWESKELAEYVVKWVDKKNVKTPLIAITKLFLADFDFRNFIDPIMTELKKQIPNLEYVIGGPRIDVQQMKSAGVKNLPIQCYRGRSLHLFEKNLRGEHINEEEAYIKVEEDVLFIETKATQPVEEPVVPTLYDDYCLMPTDVIPFETRLGCKFNCTFCHFEFRAAKNVNDACPHKIAEMMQTAKSKYGITNFSISDDTFNEDDVKVQNLFNAVSELDYIPKIIGYVRFDIMQRKQEQLEMFDKSGFWGHFYGIETFHPEAAKAVRKNIDRDSAFAFLKEVTQQYPHWFKMSGIIAGLPKEPIEYYWESIQKLLAERVLESVQLTGLSLHRIPGNERNWSDMSANPEQFGVKLIKLPNADEREAAIYHAWETDEMDSETAQILSKRTKSKFLKAGYVPNINVWEVICRNALGIHNWFDPKERTLLLADMATRTPKIKQTETDKIYLEATTNHIEAYKNLKKTLINNL